MSDLTVLYYTANVEPEAFENRVRERLLKLASHLPIVSVSQKPIDLGENICVGERGACYANEYRQILIGAQAAKTKWLVAAEADFLYSPAYFSFVPDSGDVWRYNNVWILWRSRSYDRGYRRKTNSEGAQVVRREFLIERLTERMSGFSEWRDPSQDWRNVQIYGRSEWHTYGDPEQPVVSVKSGWGMRPSTHTHRTEEPVMELPLWGGAAALRGELFQ